MVPPDNQDNEGDLAEWNDFNNQVIAEFRSNGGHVGGFWKVSPFSCYTLSEPRVGSSASTR